MQKLSAMASNSLTIRDCSSFMMASIVFTIISMLDVFCLSLLHNAAANALSAAKNVCQQSIVVLPRTSFPYSIFIICMSVLASTITRNRIRPQIIDLISFPTTTSSRKFKFDKMKFHADPPPLQTTTDNHMKREIPTVGSIGWMPVYSTLSQETRIV